MTSRRAKRLEAQHILKKELMHEPEVRVCRICRAEKPTTEYYLKDKTTGRLSSECSKCHRSNMRLKQTGWSAEAYERSFALQGGKCGICKSVLNSSRYTQFAGDHCHKTGKLRGLLCHPCNMALGLMKDSPIRLREAAAYVERHTQDEEIVSSHEQS